MKLLFYLKRNALLQNGYAPIMGRITIGRARASFSTRQAISPLAWDTLQHRAIGRNREMIRINRALDHLYERAMQCYELLCAEHPNPTPAMVRDRLFAADLSQVSLLELFARHNATLQQQVGLDRSLSTFYKYHSVELHLRGYLQAHYRRDDLFLGELDRNFLLGFHAYLLRELSCQKNTVWVYLTALKHVLTKARSEGYPIVDLFADYKLRCEYVARNFLSTEELIRLVGLKGLSSTHRLIRDCFLFSCFTGLSFIDLKQLRRANVRSLGRQRWIETARRKTGAPVQVCLFELPLAILRKYMPASPLQPIFPLPSNSWCNRCLAELMQRAGIEKRITFHAARHTFATTLTLSQGIPIELISKMLGHSSIRTTQIYATVTYDHLDTVMSRLSKSLDPIGARWRA